MEVDNCVLEIQGRPRRSRIDTQRLFYGTNPNQKTLELEGIMKVLESYSDYGGGINCSVCGKLYKSKVCLTKHLWEHSIYWDRFEGDKNHDRVLSIQAALIMYNGFHSNSSLLASLLVTSPQQEKKASMPPQLKSPYKNKSPGKRKRSSSRLSSVSMSSFAGSASPCSSDNEMSPTKSPRQV